MISYQCDICKRKIKEGDESVSAGFGNFLHTHNFCAKYGKPIADFLKKKGFGKHNSKKS